MPFRRNYGLQRADRNRAQKARNEEKLKERQERADKRKAERGESTTDETVSGPEKEGQ
jgi:hypothetical protein